MISRRPKMFRWPFGCGCIGYGYPPGIKGGWGLSPMNRGFMGKSPEVHGKSPMNRGFRGFINDDFSLPCLITGGCLMTLDSFVM